ncbi:DUF3618 domain-containing protein [Microbacterium betulae]|uniref:DUF3618 domain-containing protein n=1 Tax=Microbacterium betulae TaxID=2981139 RepID=A0AA97FHK5_9MICO|nr:DUF3618 domain-containing protein [Microbacterium sp. AB]WOF22445.1 DUF3618 domain-containing protein [Microbacterium sp. AB]
MTTPSPNEPDVIEPTTGLEEHPAAPEPAKGSSPDEIEADIERTRRSLGETVEQLAGKLDVTSRAKHRIDTAKARIADQVSAVGGRLTTYVDQARESLTDDRGKPNAKGWIGVSIVVAVVGVVLFVVRRRR